MAKKKEAMGKKMVAMAKKRGAMAIAVQWRRVSPLASLEVRLCRGPPLPCTLLFPRWNCNKRERSPLLGTWSVRLLQAFGGW